eukprot:6191541-Amphidinium_carterae.1
MQHCMFHIDVMFSNCQPKRWDIYWQVNVCPWGVSDIWCRNNVGPCKVFKRPTKGANDSITLCTDEGWNNMEFCHAR